MVKSIPAFSIGETLTTSKPRVIGGFLLRNALITCLRVAPASSISKQDSCWAVRPVQRFWHGSLSINCISAICSLKWTSAVDRAKTNYCKRLLNHRQKPMSANLCLNTSCSRRHHRVRCHSSQNTGYLTLQQKSQFATLSQISVDSVLEIWRSLTFVRLEIIHHL